MPACSPNPELNQPHAYQTGLASSVLSVYPAGRRVRITQEWASFILCFCFQRDGEQNCRVKQLSCRPQSRVGNHPGIGFPLSPAVVSSRNGGIACKGPYLTLRFYFLLFKEMGSKTKGLNLAGSHLNLTAEL